MLRLDVINNGYTISLFVALCVKVDPITHKGMYSILALKLGATENDVRSGALSNIEHTGHIRDVTSQMSWKIGFSNDAWSYNKRDRYKINLEDAIEDKMNNV
jgi:hypothetical protein